MSGSVKAIDRRTVHQICSGQVVLSLAVAVKELVENSLDAGATNIEVRLREHGLELVEVSDNGGGVSEDNFEALTLKHHTSKIKDFSDLEVGVATFGFRGEALSSLCALCDLSVTTCHSSANVGTRLEYDNDGRIKNKARCARETGTTVSLQNLFHTLPVRHKEFTRNIKKEFNRMVQMLQGYCLISTGVRIACFNQLAKGGRQLILSTTGSPTIRENIVNCFGQKQFRQLVEIVECPIDELSGEELTATNVKPELLNLFKVFGYISHCHHGYGRSAADRQFYFFNSRPCDHSKLSKTVNEVYHIYNRQQYPFVVLNITTAREHVDVNVTPDKRQVMLHQEKALLTLVKVSLTRLFEPLQEQFEASQLDQSAAGSLGTPSPLYTLTPPLSTPSLGSLARLKRSHPGSCGDRDASSERKPKQAKLWDYGSVVDKASPNFTGSNAEGDISITASEPDSESPLAKRRDSETDQSTSTTGQDDSPAAANDLPQSSPQYYSSTTTEGSYQKSVQIYPQKTASVSALEPVAAQKVGETHKTGKACSENKGRLSGLLVRESEVRTDQETSATQQRNVPTMSTAFSLGAITERLSLLHSRGGALIEGEGESEGRRFRAKINPASNSQAEEELKKHINKSDFLKMKILGQFNLGFIITKLGHDLFIVDQHASDEKYNFECLQRDTIIQHQRLIQPKPLELTAVGENVVIDNLDIFKMNGFQFEIDHEGASSMPTKRVKLIGQPVSKNWSLGPKDIDELIFMLSDGSCSSGEVIRPSAVRAMFASRACRSSIMIGTALGSSDMRKLVNHMAELQQPWCCPHGRPTMRHVIDLSKLQY